MPSGTLKRQRTIIQTENPKTTVLEGSRFPNSTGEKSRAPVALRERRPPHPSAERFHSAFSLAGRVLLAVSEKSQASRQIRGKFTSPEIRAKLFVGRGSRDYGNLRGPIAAFEKTNLTRARRPEKIKRQKCGVRREGSVQISRRIPAIIRVLGERAVSFFTAALIFNFNSSTLFPPDFAGKQKREAWRRAREREESREELAGGKPDEEVEGEDEEEEEESRSGGKWHEIFDHEPFITRRSRGIASLAGPA